MKKSDFSRRQFLGISASAAGATLAAKTIFLSPENLFAQAVAPSDRVRFGIIGIGMQGSSLLPAAIQLPGVECIAACDLYDGRHALAREIVNKPDLPVTRRYHELLENKEIDCLIAAVPDHWHKQVVVDAVNAGKDIYCEKPMSHSPADGVEMVAAAQKTKRIVQIGSQRVSSVICAKAKNCRGRQARRPDDGRRLARPQRSHRFLGISTAAGSDASNPGLGHLARHRSQACIRSRSFARWRCWKEYGTGVAGDLLVHLISGMQYMLGINEAPKRTMAMGGILRWKDGRNMPDVHASLFDYNGIPAYMRLNLGTEMPETYRFQGSKGIIEVTEFSVTYTPQTGEDSGPSYYANAFPKPLRDEYMKRWHAEHDPKPGKEPAAEAVVYRSVSFDDVKPHLSTFFNAVRSRKPVTEDAVFGHHAALACHMANESYFRKGQVSWDEGSNSIKS